MEIKTETTYVLNEKEIREAIRIYFIDKISVACNEEKIKIKGNVFEMDSIVSGITAEITVRSNQ